MFPFDSYILSFNKFCMFSRWYLQLNRYGAVKMVVFPSFIHFHNKMLFPDVLSVTLINPLKWFDDRQLARIYQYTNVQGMQKSKLCFATPRTDLTLDRPSPRQLFLISGIFNNFSLTLNYKSWGEITSLWAKKSWTSHGDADEIHREPVWYTIC